MPTATSTNTKSHTKKRPAPHSDGQKSKKAKFDSSASGGGKWDRNGGGGTGNFKAKEKGKAREKEVKEKPVQHRKRPITASKSQPATDEEEEEGNEEDWVDEDDDNEEEEGDQNDDERMDVDRPKTPKDPNANKESRTTQKAVLAQRKASKPHSSLLADAKKVWILANKKSSASFTPAQRQVHIKELMEVVRGRVKEVVFKHDASRIIQTLVKYGSQEVRDEVAKELKGAYRDLAQSRYSKFLVTKLIRLCPSHRLSILSEFQTHTIRLLLHREATSVLADAFELYANAYERSLLLREFYGKEANLFVFAGGKTELKDVSEQEKERARKGLSGVLSEPGVDKERRKRILGEVKENLEAMFNNPDKGAISHAIVHRALWEYLVAIKEFETVDGDEEAQREEEARRRGEMLELCQDVLAEIVHTKDGSRVAREFLAYGTAKDRKGILKSLKPHVENMATDDEAQNVLFTALDVIDDTKLTTKTILQALTTPEVASKLYATPQGRRTLLYTIVPRSRRHFTPAQIAVLAETDAVREKTSKKEAKAREAEVRSGASAGLVEWVEKGVKGDNGILREPGGVLCVTEVMLYAEADKTKAIDALLHALLPSPSSTSPLLIDSPPVSRMYKTLLQGGHFNHTTNTIERVPSSSWDTTRFAVRFVEVVGKEQTVEMAKGNGAFVVVELCDALMRGCLEEEGDGPAKKARKDLKKWFGKDVVEELKDESTERKGRNVLVDKLAALTL